MVRAVMMAVIDNACPEADGVIARDLIA